MTSNALRPLKALEAAAQRIGMGDYAARVVPDGSPEVSRTMLAFNDMAARIEELLGLNSLTAGKLDTMREHQLRAVARELHDSLGGNLSMLKLGLGTIEESPVLDTALREKVRSLIELADSTIHLTRGLTAALRPAMLDALGVVPTLKWYAGEFSKMTGIQCQIDLCGGVSCTKEQSTALFRVAQEAMINIARHAEASRVYLHLTQDEGNLVMEISDNGKGIRPGQAGEAGRDGTLGIAAMQQRAQYMRGNLSIKSEDGYGTTVTVRVPVLERGAA